MEDTDAEIGNPIAEFFDDPAVHKDERYRLDKRDLEARRRANLSLYKWLKIPNLDPAEEQELIRLSGSVWPGGNKLVIHHHKSALAMAGEYHGPDRENSRTVGVMASYEDRVASALLGWSVALLYFDLKHRFGLNALAEGWMRDHVGEECRLARKRGDSSDTEADRYVYHHRHESAEQVAKKVRCSLKSAQSAIDRARVYWHGHDEYNEGYCYDEHSDGDGERCSSRPVEYSTRHDYQYDCFHYGQPTAEMRCHARVVDALVVGHDRRDERWLKALGRRAYALWLVRKYRTAVTPLFARTPMAYCISINTAATASDSSDWKSDQDRLEGAAKVQPTVFDAKDQWGWYRSRKDHRPKNEIETANAADAEEKGKDNDSIRHSYPRHQASGVRRFDGNRGGDTQSSSRGGRADVARDAAGAAQGT
jgi:hypothetical protein